jgi:hypothetical protein
MFINVTHKAFLLFGVTFRVTADQFYFERFAALSCLATGLNIVVGAPLEFFGNTRRANPSRRTPLFVGGKAHSLIRYMGGTSGILMNANAAPSLSRHRAASTIPLLSAGIDERRQRRASPILNRGRKAEFLPQQVGLTPGPTLAGCAH